MSYPWDEAFVVDDDATLMDPPHINRPRKRPEKRNSHLDGQVVVVDLVSDDEESVQDNMETEIEVSFDDALTSVLQILPDVDPAYVQESFDKLPLPHTSNTIPILLSQILDKPYPRLSKKRTATAAGFDEPKEPDPLDYGNPDRVVTNPEYRKITYEVLASKFNMMPVSLIRQIMYTQNNLYAPTYMSLHTLPASNYKPLKHGRVKAGLAGLHTPAGRQVALEDAWIKEWLRKREKEEERQRIKKQEEADAEAAKLLNFKEHEEGGGLLEWYVPVIDGVNGSGCCFDECPANCMTYCSDGHLFCLSCAKMNAETVVGNGGYRFKCMDVSGCQAEFTTQEIARFVEAKTIALRDKLESENVIREATIEGFVSCPFCDYGAIIEDDNDKEFRCQNKECGIISCRSCRVESHIPLSCEEHQKEHKLSAKHIVEEAMTAALVQKCNKCSRPFVKLSGCNKMTCTCGNLQCYVCGQNIKDYNHFEQGRGNGTKCPLHENNDSRLEAKILNAREEAVKKVLEEEEGLNEEDVKVDAPVANVMAGMPARVMGDLRDRGAAFVNQIQGMMGFAQGIEHHVWQGAPVILGPYIGGQIPPPPRRPLPPPRDGYRGNLYFPGPPPQGVQLPGQFPQGGPQQFHNRPPLPPPPVRPLVHVPARPNVPPRRK